MPFIDDMLAANLPGRLRDIDLPRRQTYQASPKDWRNEVLYFLLPDRFSDGRVATRPMLDRNNLAAARPALPSGEAWRWDRWAQSGAERWQGGTLRGLRSKLGYLKNLGATTIWIGPIFKQRGHLDTYHGYGIQDFLDVDPRFGDRRDLVEMIAATHALGLRVILDIIFNHSGSNWLYPPTAPGGMFEPHYTQSRYQFGAWRDAQGAGISQFQGTEEWVWPEELADPERYTRAGSGSLAAGDIDDQEAEHKRTDFNDLRDFRLDPGVTLSQLSRCYKYWIALTDCDGFRIDTLKHVSLEQGRNFCGTIKEFAANLGKSDFFLVGEVAGGDFNQDRYLKVIEQNLNATLDIGEMRLTLNDVAKGLTPPELFFRGFSPGNAPMGSHRNLGRRHVSILDDHDHVFGQKIRYASEAAFAQQVTSGVVLQLFTLGIPCIYYGTEQAFSGPEPEERQWLPGWRSSDRYLREAMFGPEHPRRAGRAGLPSSPNPLETNLPGFGPFGTAGRHCFDEQHPVFRRIAAAATVRQKFPVLRYGWQYMRPIAEHNSEAFHLSSPGEIVTWSRILDDEEALCVVNPHPTQQASARILVDRDLNPEGDTMTVLLNTAEADQPAAGGAAITHSASSTVIVRRAASGIAYIELNGLAPMESVVLVNHP